MGTKLRKVLLQGAGKGLAKAKVDVLAGESAHVEDGDKVVDSRGAAEAVEKRKTRKKSKGRWVVQGMWERKREREEEGERERERERPTHRFWSPFWMV